MPAGCAACGAEHHPGHDQGSVLNCMPVRKAALPGQAKVSGQTPAVVPGCQATGPMGPTKRGGRPTWTLLGRPGGCTKRADCVREASTMIVLPRTRVGQARHPVTRRRMPEPPAGPACGWCAPCDVPRAARQAHMRAWVQACGCAGGFRRVAWPRQLQCVPESAHAGSVRSIFRPSSESGQGVPPAHSWAALVPKP